MLMKWVESLGSAELYLGNRQPHITLLLCLVMAGSLGHTSSAWGQGMLPDPPGLVSQEPKFISNITQLTLIGKRAGEGYYNKDGSMMVFQSERDAENPFYQIYLLDIETGDVERVSPGHGKTTCAWIHPDNNRVLFASTQDDPQALEKQREELALREAGQQRRYAWDYDENFDLIALDRSTKQYSALTRERGYDAEASYSPDGSLIAFSSNRHAFTEPLTEEQKAKFAEDPSFMLDIYLMNADGSNVRRLTNVLGYDGGPFFSADGKKICWRRFSEKGDEAEIMSMNVDGSNQQQLTKMDVMSWAPYFHPSGKYLIFATNRHGFANFELYLIDAQGKSAPVRVTYTEGFDGLPTFTPDGTGLAWTSTRHEPSSRSNSQIYRGTWNHAAAMAALGLSDATPPAVEDTEGQGAGRQVAELTQPDFRGLDLMKHVDYLCHPILEGRASGSAGERRATAYVAAYLDYLGLQPAGDNGTWFQSFEFPGGAKLGPQNKLLGGAKEWQVDRDWLPLTFSQTGEIPASSVVFAGYGINAPAEGDQPAYDSYVHLDVKDKWVLMFRYQPEQLNDAQRIHFQYHSSLRKKAMDARERGARGVIFVNGPNANARQPLVPLEKDFMLAAGSTAAISVTNEVAQGWLASIGKDLKQLQDQWDAGQPQMGFEIKNLQLSASIDVQQVVGQGRNIVGRLQAGDQPSAEAIVIGAHIDHLGIGRSGSSLARENETSNIHYGADDNASGVAAMLEIAEYLAQQKKLGKLAMKRDILFAGWSGEELGLHGSKHFVEALQKQLADQTPNQRAGGSNPLNAQTDAVTKTIYPSIVANLNMDMVGRYKDKLVLHGVSSSPYWSKAAEKNAAVGLVLKLSKDTQLPTDATSFHQAGVPILSAFTGSHEDYHTPRDTPEKLNYEDMARVAKLMGLIARGLTLDVDRPEFVQPAAASAEAEAKPRANMRAYIGSIPDYGGDVKGVLISGVTKGSPADKAGLQSGDVIVELGGKTLENIYDYTYAIEAVKPGVETTISIIRKEQKLDLKITPGRRD